MPAGRPAIWIDQLPDRSYRMTAGPLLEAYPLRRTPDLESLRRQAYRLAACRSLSEVLRGL